MLTITAYHLRRLAEKADALRDQPLTLVLEDGALDVVPTDELTLRPHATPVGKEPVEIRTDSSPGHPPLNEVTLRRPKGPDFVARTRDGFDAVMWNESAVQKFVFPYYVCTDSRDDFQRTWESYWSATQSNPIYAILHDRSRPIEFARNGVARSTGLMAVTDPVVDPRSFFGWRDESPAEQRRIELAAQGIVPVEDLAAYLSR